MKDLLEAIDAALITSDIFDRTHTEQARQQKNKKRAVLNTVLNKYKKLQAQAEKQAAMFADAGKLAEAG